MENNKVNMLFAAIDKQITKSIPSFEEKESRGKGYVSYGADNMIPEYLHGLYDDVSTLKTIINGTADYAAGDNIISTIQGLETTVNGAGESWKDFITAIVTDYLIYGGFAIEVIRNKAGKPSALNYIDYRYLRSDKDGNLFYYSEDYGKKYTRSDKTLVLPKFNRDANDANSIFYYKNERTKVYPTPLYSGAIKACEIERHIDEYHLSGLENGFYGSYVFNFLNGVPEDDQKREIEKNVNEKFCGSANVGRVLINFADSKENAATVQKLDVVDFSEKYKAAAERSREQIYCAFAAIPQLFGLTSAATGFSEQEFKEAFKLYNRTKVRSLQRMVCDKINYIFNTADGITIDPYTIEGNNDSNVD